MIRIRDVRNTGEYAYTHSRILQRHHQTNTEPGSHVTLWWKLRLLESAFPMEVAMFPSVKENMKRPKTSAIIAQKRSSVERGTTSPYPTCTVVITTQLMAIIAIQIFVHNTNIALQLYTLHLCIYIYILK